MFSGLSSTQSKYNISSSFHSTLDSKREIKVNDDGRILIHILYLLQEYVYCILFIRTLFLLLNEK
jgi:hypothetical protein